MGFTVLHVLKWRDLATEMEMPVAKIRGFHMV
jgi:hypothetical protein